MGDTLKVSDRLYVGSGQPSEDALRALAADGFASVVDLRQGARAGRCCRRRSRPPPPAVTACATCICRRRPTGLTTAMLDRFRRALNELPRPVFVHCASGKRSGTFAIATAAIESGLDRATRPSSASQLRAPATARTPCATP